MTYRQWRPWESQQFVFHVMQHVRYVQWNPRTQRRRLYVNWEEISRLHRRSVTSCISYWRRLVRTVTDTSDAQDMPIDASARSVATRRAWSDDETLRLCIAVAFSIKRSCPKDECNDHNDDVGDNPSRRYIRWSAVSREMGHQRTLNAYRMRYEHLLRQLMPPASHSDHVKRHATSQWTRQDIQNLHQAVRQHQGHRCALRSFSPTSWITIAQAVGPHRTPMQCRYFWEEYLRPHIERHSNKDAIRSSSMLLNWFEPRLMTFWTPQEDALLLQSLDETIQETQPDLRYTLDYRVPQRFFVNLSDRWVSHPSHLAELQPRSARQLATRYCHFLSPKLVQKQRPQWSQVESDVLREAVEEYGGKWKEVAKSVVRQMRVLKPSSYRTVDFVMCRQQAIVMWWMERDPSLARSFFHSMFPRQQKSTQETEVRCY